MKRYYTNFILPFLRHPLNRRNKLAAVIRFLSWQLLLRLSAGKHAEILAPYVGDVRMLVKKSLSGLTGNLYSGLHEFEEMIFILHYLDSSDTFFDVGANAGSYTLLAGGVKKCTCYSFEPVPQTFLRLKQNADINGLDGIVTLYNTAVGLSRGRIWFTDDRDTMNHFVGEDYTGSRISVDVISLDEELFEKGVRPAVMKVDTEGYDLQVIEGAKRLIANRSLNVILVELGEVALVERLLFEGFHPVSYDGFTREIHSREKDQYSTIFIRDIDLARERVSQAGKIEILGRLI